MTRKKSNVKALALAVTCAILAGGGIGLKPVYAVQALYKENYKGYITADATGATGGADATKWKLTVIDSGLKIGEIDLGLTKKGAITAGSLTLGTDYDVKQNIEDAKAKINTVEGNLTTNQNNLSTLEGRVGVHDTKINALETKTQGITRGTDGDSTTVDGVNFKNGAVAADGVAAKNITANNFVTVGDTTNGYVHITNAGIAVSGRLYSSLDPTATDLKSVSVEEMANTRDNTQKISYADDDRVLTDKATYIKGITHAGDVRLANGEVRAKRLVLEEDFAGGTSAQATLTRESIVNLHGMIDGKTKIKVADGSEVGGVKFDQGKVTNVVSINDNLKFESDGIYLNKGDQAKQIKIGADGKIIIGTSSSAYDTNGFYAGGDNYDAAKAGMKSDGSLKATGFAVDGTTGNTTVGGTLDVTGATTLGSTLAVKGNTTVGGTLGVTGKTTLSNDLQVDGKATFGSAVGSQTVIEGGNITAGGKLTSESAKIGSVGIDNTGAITGVTSLTTKALTVTGAFTTDGNLTVHGDLTASGAINGKTISITDGGSIAGVKFATDGNLTATTGKIGGVSFAASGVVSGVNDFTSTIIRDGAGTIITSGNVKSNTANIGAIRIDNEQIEGSSASGLTIENVKIKDGVVSDVTSLTADKATIGGVNTLDNNGIRVATGKNIQVGVNTKIEDGSIAVSTNTKLTDQALNLNTTNTWTAAGGLVADKATVNGVVLGADGDTGKATFTDANGSTTIAGKNITTGKIIADELLIDKISLGKNGSSNISIDNSGNVTTEGEITIKDATGAVMSKLSQDKATFGKDAMNQTTISKGDITATAKNAADSQQSTLTHNNKGFKVEGKDAGGTKASSFGFDTSTGIGTFTGQDNSTTAINGSKMTLVNDDNRTELTAGGVTFTGKDYKDATAKGTTVIDGNTITTGKLVTDELVITGKGNADGNGGSIAFGGNGTIKSDINDGTTNGKNTSFETTLDGVNTKVTDGTTTTENKVTAAGNSNTVTKDEKHKSEFNQGLTSIGGVVTNGEIKVAQKLDGATGLLTNEVTDANGSSKLEQSGTGLTYTDSAKPDNATRIDSSDVSIGSASNPDKRINLSDLGQIDELDKEIRDNEVYKNNETAVGGINAEAAIRRGEVERLDNRISEEVTRLDGRINDVNDRVNKVGAMAAAIASLKSIGYDPQAPSEFSIGLGQYKGETGVAMGFFHYPNKNFMINVSLSTAGGETMGGIGATWRFGHKSPQKLLEEQREEQAKKELAAAEKYQAAAKLAKEAQERAEYAAKLARQAQVSADNAKAAADATQAKHFG